MFLLYDAGYAVASSNKISLRQQKNGVTPSQRQKRSSSRLSTHSTGYYDESFKALTDEEDDDRSKSNGVYTVYIL